MRAFGWSEFLFILSALQWTLLLTVVALVVGGVCGLLVALLRIQSARWMRLLSAGYIELFQGTPLLLQLFVVYFGIGLFGVNVDAWTAAAVALSAHTAAFLGEIWRGSIQAVPRGQWEGAHALALSYGAQLRLVILPQAVRIAIAPTVGFVVQLIKGTSVTALIGFTEITRAGQLVNNVTLSPFIVYGVVAGLYMLLCWPISILSRRLEKGLDRTRRSRPGKTRKQTV